MNREANTGSLGGNRKSVGWEKQKLYTIIREKSCLRVSEVFIEAEKLNISRAVVEEILDCMFCGGLVYEPKPGFIEVVEY